MASTFTNKAIFSFITLTLSTAFLIVFVYGVTYGLELQNKDLKKGVTVSGISVSELPKEVAKEKIEAEIQRWKETGMVSFQYQDKEVTKANTELFFFDIEETVQNIGTSKEVLLTVFLNEEYIEDIFGELQIKDELLEQLDRRLLSEELQTYAQSLRNEHFIVNLHHYLGEEVHMISSVKITDFFRTNYLIEAVHLFDGYELRPKEEFSFAEVLIRNRNDFIDDHLYSMIASIIYRLSLETNFEIRERHISDVLPAYSELGTEAKVDRDQDLKLYNPNATSYFLNFQFEEDYLTASLTGIPFTDTYDLKLSNHEKIDFETIIETDMNVKGVKVKQKGQKGHKINVHRIRSQSGNVIKEEWISDDVYVPVPSIELHGKEEGFEGVKGY